MGITPKFKEHCIKMYEALDERAIEKKLESGKRARVFAGRYTEVWEATKIPQTYYSPIRKALEKNNAILILQKGAANTDTVIVLQGLPSEWSGDGWLGQGDLTKRLDYATLSVQVEEISKLLGGVNLPKALIEIERRLVALETAEASGNVNKPQKSKSVSK